MSIGLLLRSFFSLNGEKSSIVMMRRSTDTDDNARWTMMRPDPTSENFGDLDQCLKKLLL